MIWVPFSVKYGKRPVLLISMGMLFAVLVWTAKAKTFGQILAARCLSGFVSAAGEVSGPGREISEKKIREAPCCA
ncbi:putative mfs transporter [Ilyonectria robusta]